jgi:ADP-ribose pyrophosphatase YjhB (NUDIX family)
VSASAGGPKPEGKGAAGYLPKDLYERIRRSIPIVCVDLLLWRWEEGGDQQGGREILLIERLDRDGELGLTLIGGRIRLDEPIAAAAERHLRDAVGGELSWHAPDWSRPQRVAEYVRGWEGEPTFDPAQNSIALTYLVEADRCFAIRGSGEALGLHWFPLERPPDVDRFGFGQGALVHELTEELALS